MKISFCTTCKGRLGHLRETLVHNLALEAGSSNVEFVIVDYDSNDGMANWIASTFEDEISTGKLIYARYEPAPNFKMAHAKNMAHRIATGDVICNVDADNFLSTGYASMLRDLFNKYQPAIASPRQPTALGFLRQRYIDKILRRKRPVDGICGRIAITRSSFYALRGYDENFSGWGGDDIDFLLRARDAGIKVITLPQNHWGRVVRHSNDERLSDLSEDDKNKSLANLSSSYLNQFFIGVTRMLSKHIRKVNVNGNVGCGEVVINFAEKLEIGAIT